MARRGWDGFLDMQARPVTRRLRKLFVGSYLFCISAQYAGVVFSLMRWREGAGSRIYGIGAFLYVSTAMGQALLWMFLIRRVNSGMSLEDRAQLDFGKPYGRLSSRQKFDVWVRVRREMQAGGRAPDERDALAQREAEGRAVRILQVGVPVFVTGFWVVCLCLPASGVRVGLLIGAAVMSVMAIAVVILPDVIRMWTQPDEVGEPKVVPMGREA
jgi:hypothetical protein